MTARLAADIGGTFTDLVLLDSGGVVHVAKTLSTPGDFKEGVLGGVERVLSDAGAEAGGAIALSEVDYFVHGATVVLNALLERKLPKAALVTTRGFRDVLEIMRTNNPRMYDLKWVKPKPIIPRHLRFEVDERVRHTGEVLRPLDEAGTRETARRIKALDIRSVALCFLHAYANPDHERRAREIILEEHPAAHVTISSDVASELREFERTSTVAINASTIPIISAYLDGLSQALSDRGLERELFVMQSNGGVIASRTARSLPVRTVMSGPAGGVVGAQFIANRMGLRDVATIDIGGTSSDMGVISEGLARTVDQSTVEGWPIMAPTIEILAIGAGGGSIAWVDAGGALRVGPQSAGARPGPACYGQGGAEPTVSDACVTLNRLNPDYFLAGEMALDRDAAERAIRERIAEPLGMDIADAAEGILRVVTANMNKAIRSILIARGFDIRAFTLMAFGGAAAWWPASCCASATCRGSSCQAIPVPSRPSGCLPPTFGTTSPSPASRRSPVSRGTSSGRPCTICGPSAQNGSEKTAWMTPPCTSTMRSTCAMSGRTTTSASTSTSTISTVSVSGPISTGCTSTPTALPIPSSRSRWSTRGSSPSASSGGRSSPRSASDV